jgi:uncharacterized protein (TIGR01777 family)
MAFYQRRSTLPFGVGEVMAWHARAGAFERLSAPWQHVRPVEPAGAPAAGDRTVFEYGLGPLRGRWTAVRKALPSGLGFVDVQESGPFAFWRHEHRFEPDGEKSTVLDDRVDYELPGPRVVAEAARPLVDRRIDRLFQFRHARTRHDLERHALFADRPPLKVAVTGASGFIGSHLVAFLTAGGHEVVPMTRRRDAGPQWIHWDPRAGVIDASLDGVDAIVHLAGESIAGVWTRRRRREILESRRLGTTLIARAAASLRPPPGVIVTASAVGWYGDRGDEDLNEDSGPGTGFLAEVCRVWDDSLEPARGAGIRSVTTRFAPVMGGAGGVLAVASPPFRLAAGARLGGGEQWMSWIAIDDVLAALLLALHEDGLEGAVNVTSPNPVTNREFTETLARVVRRPAPFVAPRTLIERGLGEMGRDMLLTSQRVRPARLAAAGFRWLFPDLESALRFELGR